VCSHRRDVLTKVAAARAMLIAPRSRSRLHLQDLQGGGWFAGDRQDLAERA